MLLGCQCHIMKGVILQELKSGEQKIYNLAVSHPLQSWEWGEFRKKTGVKVVRFLAGARNRLAKGFQLTIHKIPPTPWSIGYLPKSHLPTTEVVEELTKIGQENHCLFIKLEPNVISSQSPHILISQHPNILISLRPLFTKYTFQIDLTKSEEELLGQMKEKTRYNVRLAQRYGVTVKEDNSPEAFKIYLKLMAETTKRQKFFAHDEQYHRLLWQTLHPAGIAHLLVAQLLMPDSRFPITLAAWILFTFNKVLYYPYGASSSEHREMMASNLMMWETMRFGKKIGCQTFDLWGCLGPNPDKGDPWYGFHRFKEGYGGKLVEFVGTYDLVLKPTLYKLYNLVDNLRWRILKLKKTIIP